MIKRTDEDTDDLTIRLISVLLEKHFREDLREMLLKGLTGDDYIEQKKRISVLYRKNFNKR